MGGEEWPLGGQLWNLKEKLLGCRTVPLPTVKRNLLKEKLVSIEYLQGDSLKPKIHVDISVLDEFATSWEKNNLLVKVLGKMLGFNMMKVKLRSMWRPRVVSI